MREVTGNLWTWFDMGSSIVITTNGTIKKNGEAVMGSRRGTTSCALEARLKYPQIPGILGMCLKRTGNVPHMVMEGIYTLPVKHNWWEKADPQLIESSLPLLVSLVGDDPIIVVPRPGCGNGQLDWETQVKPICKKYLDNRFIVITKG